MSGLLQDQADADRGGEVVDDVALVDELADDGRREDRFDDQVEVGPLFEMGDVRARAGREIVKHEDLPAGAEQQFREVRADKAGAAGDEGFRLGRVTRAQSAQKRTFSGVLDSDSHPPRRQR